MKLPNWVNLLDLGIHVALGALLTGILTWLGAPLSAGLVASLACGTCREFSEVSAGGKQWSDMRAVNGGPANGLADIGAWGLGTLGYWLVSLYV